MLGLGICVTLLLEKIKYPYPVEVRLDYITSLANEM